MKKQEPEQPTRRSTRLKEKSFEILISCPMCDASFSEMSAEVSNHIKTHI